MKNGLWRRIEVQTRKISISKQCECHIWLESRIGYNEIGIDSKDGDSVVQLNAGPITSYLRLLLYREKVLIMSCRFVFARH